VQFNGWGTYKQLTIKFNPDEELGKYNINAPKKYKNSRTYRLGGQYAATKRLDLRLGAYFDETPVKNDYLNPETPSMNKLGLSAGLSFRPMNSLSVDVAFSYITGFGRNGSYTDKDLLGQPRTFGGHYNIAAMMPSIGLSYAF
jgi:long-chain fatty acid transport protein